MHAMMHLWILLAAFSLSQAKADDCTAEADYIRMMAESFAPNQTILTDTKMVQTIWEARQALRNRFITGQDPTRECAESVVRAVRALRSIEDYYSFVQYFAALTSGQPLPRETAITPTIQGGSTALLPQGSGKIELQAGDILLSRAKRISSATISNLGTIPTQFSHLGFVHKTEEGEIILVEAHIEVGSTIASLEKYAGDGKARMALFRYKDADLAKLAAKMIHDRVQAALDDGEAIHYDFAFDHTEDEAIFCSETARVGFSMASNGKVLIPRFMSSLEHPVREIQNRLGILGKEGFLPADIEMDPDFTEIAEWRDPSQMQALWSNDAVLGFMQERISKDGYEFDPEFSDQAKGEFALELRNGILGNWLLGERFPPYMPIDTLVSSFVLDKIGYGLRSRLDDASIPWTVKHDRVGLPPTKKEQRKILEEVLEADRKSYCERSLSPFVPFFGENWIHALFHPKEGVCVF